MPRHGSITEDVVKVLRLYPEGATMAEIRTGVESVRGHVLDNSIRSAVSRNLENKGEGLFRRTYRRGEKRHARYFLKA
jgi:hypothetical protein